jgi:PTH1 family peptidyl-tRNA hydrolase
MKLIVGLGNYGEEYKKTRHNAGFMALEKIVENHNLDFSGNKLHSRIWRGKIGNHEIITIAPQTYMNKSGMAALAVSSFYKIALQDIIVIHDDLDLATARLKVKIGGGNGGHNGLKDIDRAMGKDYLRIRIGIDRPNHSGEVSNYVLSNFSSHESAQINYATDFIACNFHQILKGDFERFMTDYALQQQAI